MMENKQDVKIKKMPHHEPKGPCLTRPPYRQGKKLTAVKVLRTEYWKLYPTLYCIRCTFLSFNV